MTPPMATRSSALLHRAHHRISGAGGDEGRSADQRHHRLVGAFDKHHLHIESLLIEETLAPRHPNRAVAERLRRRADRQFDFLLRQRIGARQTSELMNNCSSNFVIINRPPKTLNLEPLNP